jgi:type I restriction enzyme S subunit
MNIWNDCPKIPITELLEFIVDNRGKTVPTAESGHILIATNCVRNESLYPKYEKVRYLSQDTYNNFFRAHPIPGDILFVNKGTPGRVCLVPDPIDFCIAQDMIALRVDKSKVDNHYLLAVLRSPQIQRHIYNISVGDVIPHFKKQFMDTILIPMPPMNLQEKIGNYYYEMSEKIETNSKINARLEEMAQAIFKDWFVDFTPFKNGKFVDSELGMIPEGWRVGALTEIANYMNGLAMQKFPPECDAASLPVLKIKELGQGFCDTNSDRCSTDIKEEYKICNGDVIFSWSGTLLVDIWCGGKCGLNQHLFKVTSNNYPKWYYYYWTKYHLANFIRIAKDKAVTMGHIKRGHLDEALVAIPTENVMAKATGIISPLLDSIISKRIESTRLASLRDTLLPKLMSGEIEV